MIVRITYASSPPAQIGRETRERKASTAEDPVIPVRHVMIKSKTRERKASTAAVLVRVSAI